MRKLMMVMLIAVVAVSFGFVSVVGAPYAQAQGEKKDDMKKAEKMEKMEKKGKMEKMEKKGKMEKMEKKGDKKEADKK